MEKGTPQRRNIIQYYLQQIQSLIQSHQQLYQLTKQVKSSQQQNQLFQEIEKLIQLTQQKFWIFEQLLIQLQNNNNLFADNFK